MKWVFLLMGLLLVSIVAAEEIVIGDYAVEYDEMFSTDSDDDGRSDMDSYYLERQLVFTAFDTDGNTKKDIWLHYDDELYLDAEIVDSDEDGVIDSVVRLDRNEEVATEGSLAWLWILLAIVAGIVAWFYLQRK